MKLLIATRQGDNFSFLNNTRKPLCAISVLISHLRKEIQSKTLWKSLFSVVLVLIIEHVYMRPKVNLNRFGISNRFEKSFRLNSNFATVNIEVSNPFQKLFRLHGDFTAATFQTKVRLQCACAKDSFTGTLMQS